MNSKIVFVIGVLIAALVGCAFLFFFQDNFDQAKPITVKGSDLSIGLKLVTYDPPLQLFPDGTVSGQKPDWWQGYQSRLQDKSLQKKPHLLRTSAFFALYVSTNSGRFVFVQITHPGEISYEFNDTKVSNPTICYKVIDGKFLVFDLFEEPELAKLPFSNYQVLTEIIRSREARIDSSGYITSP